MAKQFILIKNMKYRVKKHNGGMTLIELMTAVVIIGILVGIGVSNYVVSSKKRALEASLMTNIRTLQIMLETYKVDWQVYPVNLSELSLESTNKKYNKSVTNPYTQQSGPIGSSNIWAIDFKEPIDPDFISNRTLYKGRVGYLYDNTNKKYNLFGYDDKSDLLIRNNQIYTITNGG
jgi:prepilin-type N-terminal cleavage/methylation domain-containing protein